MGSGFTCTASSSGARAPAHLPILLLDRSPTRPLRWRYVRISPSAFSSPITAARMEPVFRPARDQRKENHRPVFSKPSRWRYRTSTLWHSPVVIFLLNLYQSPLPTPPIGIYLPSFLPYDFGKKHYVG